VSPNQTERETAAQKIPEANHGDDGWADGPTMDGEEIALLSFAVILLEKRGEREYWAY
jgi:hypothetical protein